MKQFFVGAIISQGVRAHSKVVLHRIRIAGAGVRFSLGPHMIRNKKLEIIDRGGSTISFRKFKAANKEELLMHATTKKQLISNGVLTSDKIRKLVEKKKLSEIIFANEVYFERNEVTDCLKNWIDKRK